MTAAAHLSPVDLIQAQLEAYNAQDLDAYCAFFADDIQVADLNGAVNTKGIEAYRAKDPVAHRLWLESINALAVTIASVINTVDPEAVIIGLGSVVAPSRTGRPGA